MSLALYLRGCRREEPNGEYQHFRIGYKSRKKKKKRGRRVRGGNAVFCERMISKKHRKVPFILLDLGERKSKNHETGKGGDEAESVRISAPRCANVCA